MPSECRILLFDDHEIVRAISEYRRWQGRGVPPGSVVKTWLYGEPEFEFRMRIADARDQRCIDITVLAEELCAALVLFCIQRMIPLPARGFAKTLQIYDGQVIMAITDGSGVVDIAPDTEIRPREGTGQYDVDIRPGGAVLLQQRLPG